jgi:hypothetical protein
MTKHTKYFIINLAELVSGEMEAMNVNLPMNTPVMLVRRGGRLELKRLNRESTAPRGVQQPSAEQVSLL